MNLQTAVDTRKRAAATPTSGILRHAAVRSVSHGEGPGIGSEVLGSTDGEHDTTPARFGGSRFAHDFSRVGVHARAEMADSEVPEEATENLDANGGNPAAGAPLPAGVPAAPPAPAAPAAPAALPPVTATVPSHIRAPSTPTGMPDRIPPRVDTSVNVSVSGWSLPMNPVVLSIDGAGGGNGTVTINGGATADLTGSATVRLQGGTQTGVGNAGNLRLVASQGGTELARSNGFSVAAIPQNFSITFNSELTGARRGIIVNNHWESDSGNVADLNEVERSEQVQYMASSGILAGYSGLNSGFLPAHNPPTTDTHSTGVAMLNGPSAAIGVIGRAVAEQVFIFNDRRTGATNIPVTRSGYRLTREVGQLSLVGQYVREFGITKAGTATTANGYSSAAGAGTVTRV
jgi:hypothetical protein